MGDRDLPIDLEVVRQAMALQVYMWPDHTLASYSLSCKDFGYVHRPHVVLVNYKTGEASQKINISKHDPIHSLVVIQAAIEEGGGAHGRRRVGPRVFSPCTAHTVQQSKRAKLLKCLRFYNKAILSCYLGIK